MNILEHFSFTGNESVSSALQAHYDYRLVLLSILLAVISSYTAFLLSRHIKSCEHGMQRLMWLYVGAFTLGGGIWAMHFIGMLAYSLPITIKYNVGLTIVSVIPAILASLVVLETTDKQAPDKGRILLPSIFMGGGIGIMHYTGMAAMQMNGVMRYDFWLFVLSIITAVILAGISLKVKLLADRHAGSNSIFSYRLVLPAVIMGGAVSAMHYIGMAALFVFPGTKAGHIVSATWLPADLARVISVVVVLLCIILITAIEISRRFELYRIIKDSEQDLTITLNSIGDAVIATDAEGSIKRMNPVAEKLTGWSLDDARGKNIRKVFNIVNAVTREPVRNPVDKVILTGNTVSLSNHTTLISKDGKEYQIADSASPIKDADGDIKGMVLVFSDTSKQYELREKARKSRNELQAIMNNSPSIIFVTDDEGVLTFANRKFGNLLGMTMKDTTGKNISDVLPEEMANEILQKGQKAIRHKEAIKSEIVLGHKDGAHIYESVHFPLFEENSQTYAVCVMATDITERRKTDEIMQNIALGVSAQIGEAFFESLALYLANTFSFEYTLIGLKSRHSSKTVKTVALCVDGVIQNNVEYSTAGTPCEQVLEGYDGNTKSFSSGIQQVFPDDPMLAELNVQGYVGVPLVDTNHKSIGLIAVMSRNEIINTGLIENVLQIFAVRTVAEIDRIKSEEVLLKSSQEWSFAMDFFEDAIYLVDLEGRLIRANKAFYNMTGLTAGDATGMDIDCIINPGCSPESCPVSKAYIELRDSDIVLEPDDPNNMTSKPVQITVRIIRNNKGDPLSILTGIRDLSNVRAAEKENARLQHELHQSQKMDALGKLTGGIAHDYNNMLGVIMGYSDLLYTALTDQPKLARYAQQIHHASKRGAKLTHKLLAFARHDAFNARSVDLNTLIRSQQDMLEKTLTVRIKLKTSLAPDLWPIWIDESEMEDAILNISINSMHAIEGNGLLTISTCNKSLNETDVLSLGVPPGDYVLLSISDTGCGMDEETRGKVFEPFFSTKGEMGTGLGLSQVYGFVKSNNGAIKVYSEPGHGSEFTLYFPRHSDSNDLTHQQSNNQYEDVSGTETILVVDDEPAILNLSCEILSQHGFVAMKANSASEALEILEHQPVDLILSDIIMPDMNGYQLAAVIREKYPEIKVQLASGYSDIKNVDMVDNDLQNNILLKPFNIQKLLRRIRTLLDGKDIA